MPLRLPPPLSTTLVLPIIAAPMFLVSGPDLVNAARRAGIVGSFPAPNARTIADLDDWCQRITAAQPDGETPLGPWAINLITHRTYGRLAEELALVARYRPPIVITALGGPAPALEVVHGYGGLVFADVNSVTFARKAAATGVDGLILVAAGAGGHTGQIAPAPFIAAVRAFWEGIIVLAGGITTGRDLLAARALGADLAYLGTRFIATPESQASAEYKAMIVTAELEDILPTAAFTGVTANMLRPSIRRAGLDPETLQPRATVDFAEPQGDAKPWRDIWSAGQGVGPIHAIQPVRDIVADLRREYLAARSDLLALPL